ncbi:MAG: hypothetical protein ACKV22_17395 [Bryobacteraceae bacterium]
MGWLLVAVAALAQEQPLDPRSSVRIDLADDAPLAVMQADLGQSRATARGGAMILDLRMLLTLKNTSARRVRAVTMLVAAQEVTPGGKASVAVPSLDVAPGATFPIRIDLRLLRPLAAGAGPLINVGLDGVLFNDLSFYGPNRLDSRRAMLVWEAEAQRDRLFFKSVLASRGHEGLQQEVLASLDRQAQRPRVDVEVARGRTVTSAANERQVRFAFLDMPDAPVAATEGVALVHGNEARAPRIDVQNRSAKAVRHFEIGWLVRDPKGTAYWAASIPGGHEPLAPGASARASQESRLRFTTSGKEPVTVASMSGFVSQVEFADGNVWVPDRRSLANHQLLRIVAPSAEEQRLAELYRRKGLQALMDELKKF